MKDQGTRVIIYNLWEDDQGQLELDFDVDPHVCLITSRPPTQNKKNSILLNKIHTKFDIAFVLGYSNKRGKSR